jgi:hypothetical protein
MQVEMQLDLHLNDSLRKRAVVFAQELRPAGDPIPVTPLEAVAEIV